MTTASHSHVLEHLGDVLDALEIAEDALVELEAGKRVVLAEETTAGPSVSRWADKSDRERADRRREIASRPRRYQPAQIRRAWDQFRSGVEEHLEREEGVLVPMLDSSADPAEAGVEALVHSLLAEHDELARLAGLVRAALLVAEPVRPEVEQALKAYDEHARSQDLDIYPSLLERYSRDKDTATTPVSARYRNSDEVARSLRAGRPSTVIEEPPVKAFFRRLFGGSD